MEGCGCKDQALIKAALFALGCLDWHNKKGNYESTDAGDKSRCRWIAYIRSRPEHAGRCLGEVKVCR